MLELHLSFNLSRYEPSWFFIGMVWDLGCWLKHQ